MRSFNLLLGFAAVSLLALSADGNQFTNSQKSENEIQLEDPALYVDHPTLSAINDVTPWQKNFLTCTLCTAIVSPVLDYMKDIKYTKMVMGFMGALCMELWYGQETCKNIIQNFAFGYSLYGFANTLKVDFICGDVFKTCPTTGLKTAASYATAVLAGKSADDVDNDVLQETYNTVMSGSGNTYKVLHLTDIHVDYNYVAGSTTECGELICCQAKHGEVEPLAETYGNPNCDTPADALDKMLASIAASHTPDLILITGALVSRDLSLTQPDAPPSLLSTLSKIAAVFPATQTYVALSGWEFGPQQAQLFPTVLVDGVSSDHLTTLIGKVSIGAPYMNATSIAEAKMYGYYSIVKLANSGTATALERVMLIVLNTQACNTFNLGLLKEKSDAGGQLNWLQIRLAQAKTDSMHVFIIGHIPPGSPQCNSQWSKRYHAIIEKYQGIIRFQAFGNPEGRDGFKVQYPSTGNLENPFGVIHIGGAMGTYQMNPMARLYIMDSMQNIPLYVQKLTFDLDFWNQNVGVSWLYNLKTPTVTDLGPWTIDAYANEMLTDSTLAEEYYEQAIRNFDSPGCDDSCAKAMYCQIMSMSLDQEIDCTGSLEVKKWAMFALQKLENPWV
ncbi:hypothetical protein FGO68_gene7320 [Halteria grandinella]|uniref:Saposin B-type domain-containing protein n=1 Tax=Halteria grandinella TaxID=5974 RepID=A0A8J8T4G3_HALGN|nr:hypothetical protein FGO68_gene7320 [Halteria grandinella]